MILGESGSGKTAGLREYKPGEILVFNVANKPLPFRTKLDTIPKATYEVIGEFLKENKYKTYAIDDSQYLMAFEMFSRAKETGYNKFTDIAIRFKNMLAYITEKMPSDKIVFLLHHTEQTETGKIKAKTIGKMLDNQLTLEGLFAIVLLCQTDGSRHFFITQSDGYTTVKSPMGMFDLEINNDLKMAEQKIREYYNL